MSDYRKNSIFITGTDTSVGKTYITALLLDFLHRQGRDVSYQKWVSTGDDKGADDLDHCLSTAGLIYDAAALDIHVPHRFKLPAAPHLAAEQEGRRVDPDWIISNFKQLAARHELLLVEGVGGLHVPLTREILLADLLAQLAIPTLIVARTCLGTINHTLLTIEALKRRQIPILGVVFSDSTKDENELLATDNIQTIGQMAKIKTFGRLRRCDNLKQAKEQFTKIGQALLTDLPQPDSNQSS